MNFRRFFIFLSIGMTGLFSASYLRRNFVPHEDQKNIQERIELQQHGNKAIIKFDHFTVAENEIIHFETSSPVTSTLIRVNSYKPVIINGTLSSKGSLKIIAPGGIIVGPTAIIDLPQTSNDLNGNIP